jgi:hypothetical protein
MKPLTTMPLAALACAAFLVPTAFAQSGPAPEPAAVGEAPQAEAPVPDERAPVMWLRARRTQRLAPVLRAYAVCDERCEFETRARVHGVPDLRALRVITPSKASEGGTRMTFEVHVSPRAEKLIRRALRAGRDVRVSLEVTAYDLAENATERSLTIRVEPPAPDAPPFRRS